MYILQSDLFEGMKRDFIKKVMEKMAKETYEPEDTLFAEGDPAKHFYVLLKGRIKLSHGGGENLVHIVSKPGEAFGWSSLVGRDTYSATAECLSATKVIKIKREDLERIIEDDPRSGVVFYKRVAALIGQRLINSYESLRMDQRGESAVSFGTGQILESAVST